MKVKTSACRYFEGMFSKVLYYSVAQALIFAAGTQNAMKAKTSPRYNEGKISKVIYSSVPLTLNFAAKTNPSHYFECKSFKALYSSVQLALTFGAGTQHNTKAKTSTYRYYEVNPVKRYIPQFHEY